ncbi:MAG: ribosome small subunit-dependent GTPase A [Woeseia sp.]|jgi:ribosome biogenesis GTPase / thiamine phosphate phosphatase|nr:ribosome small subunit-dependent GTPase A [Woeseia sp.]
MTVEVQQECLVVGVYSRRMTLQLEHHGEINARIKGKKIRPVCGDRVIAEPIQNEPDWLITSICSRRNELNRPNNRGRKEILAANLDLIIAMAAVEPEPDWFIVDRYIAAAEFMDAKAAVVLNKSDLRDPSSDTKAILDDYAKIGYSVLTCSAESGANLPQIEALVDGKIAIIVGQSGVGKSSVINEIIRDGEQRTGELSKGSGEGRHTTVNSVMLEFAGGGAVIDSPGVRDYAPSIENIQDISQGFREIQEHDQNCRFANCIHLREPNCAVKNAVDEGTISTRRYESYRRLRNTTQKLADKFD